MWEMLEKRNIRKCICRPPFEEHINLNNIYTNSIKLCDLGDDNKDEWPKDYPKDWKNMLIWGDNKLVMSSLIKQGWTGRLI